MYSVRPNVLLRSFYPSAIWKFTTKEKKIFLTFDDGPVSEITSWVLDTLKKYKAKATFFCVGENIEKNPDIFRQIISDGHSIGNHTYNHLNGWKTKTKKYLENIEQCNSAISCHSSFVIRHSSFPFRPPYGKMKRSQFLILNSQFSVVMWDVLSGDFDQTTSEEKCLENVLTKTREGSIIVFHDSIKAKRNLFYTLPKFLKHFSKAEFEFCRLSF